MARYWDKYQSPKGPQVSYRRKVVWHIREYRRERKLLIDKSLGAPVHPYGYRSLYDTNLRLMYVINHLIIHNRTILADKLYRFLNGRTL